MNDESIKKITSEYWDKSIDICIDGIKDYLNGYFKIENTNSINKDELLPFIETLRPKFKN